MSLPMEEYSVERRMTHNTERQSMVEVSHSKVLLTKKMLIDGWKKSLVAFLIAFAVFVALLFFVALTQKILVLLIMLVITPFFVTYIYAILNPMMKAIKSLNNNEFCILLQTVRNGCDKAGEQIQTINHIRAYCSDPVVMNEKVYIIMLYSGVTSNAYPYTKYELDAELLSFLE